MSLNIINANIVLPNETVNKSSVTIENGIISKIDGSLNNGIIIDAKGAYLLPGMIDIHSTHIEKLVEPRSGSDMNASFALHELERQVINNGITTMYHSLMMMPKGNTGERVRIMRDDEHVKKIIQEVINLNGAKRLIDHKIHIRVDVTYSESIDMISDMLICGDVSRLSFVSPISNRVLGWDLKKENSLIKESNPSLIHIDNIMWDKLSVIAKLAKSKGISIASHDDDSIEKIDFVKNVLNTRISEFPLEISIARYAKKSGMEVLAGAANVLLGKSHSGNMSAIDGILDGCISMLCSDYYPPAMIQAVFILHFRFNMPLCDCVKLVTLSPANAVGIEEKVGSIAVGKRADLILVDFLGEYPNVTTVIANGNIASSIKYNY